MFIAPSGPLGPKQLVQYHLREFKLIYYNLTIVDLFFVLFLFDNFVLRFSCGSYSLSLHTPYILCLYVFSSSMCGPETLDRSLSCESRGHSGVSSQSTEGYSDVTNIHNLEL